MKFIFKWVTATLAGAATMFTWGGFSHMVMLKGVGFSSMSVSNEERIVSALRTSLPGDGLYFLPNIDIRGNPTAGEESAWEARFHAGPTGMIVYHAAGDNPISPKKLLLQLLSHLLAAGILSYFLSLTVAGYWKRIALAGLLGGFGLFAISTIYWNWYGFPNDFFFAQAVDMTVGWSLAGAVIARLIPSIRTLSANRTAS